MQGRKYKIILVGIVFALTLRLGLLNHEAGIGFLIRQEENGTVPSWNINSSIRIMAEMENQMAKEKVLRDDQKKSYMDLYPDMYVESIKPVIHLEKKKLAYLTFDYGRRGKNPYDTKKLQEITYHFLIP